MKTKLLPSSRLLALAAPLLLAATLATLITPSARAAILTSGGASFQTGTPTPTLQISAPITLTITTSGAVRLLAFDEWVTSDGSQSLVSSPSVQTLSFTLAGTAGTATINFLADNQNDTTGSLTANDGYLFFSTGIAVTAGQTLVVRPGTFTFGANAAFNPNTPTAFTGNVFAANNSGVALSGLAPAGNVPEPGTWALLVVGAGALGLALHRRRRA